MQELYQLITERMQKVEEVARNCISSERFRLLKEEERARVERENFILSMMRVNKSLQTISKNLYFKYSHEIMCKINPEFHYQFNLDRLEENFLNDFVGLFRTFFHKYEEMFNFKLKLQNLIRPTNHNLIIDLVRYLVDFSRDYYQQTFFWYMKSHGKMDKIEEVDSRDIEEEGGKEQSQQVQVRREQHTTKERRDIEAAKERKSEAFAKKVCRGSLHQISLQRSSHRKNDGKENSFVKRDPQKNYQILDITGFPAQSSMPKDSTTNVEVLKIRINEVYRDMRSRNQFAKSNINAYYVRYFGEGSDPKQKEYAEPEEESINKATHPFKLNLTIEKNGFNFISVAYSEARYNKGRDKKLMPLKVSQRLIPVVEVKSRMDFMLTSLKVIRISDSFLPALLQTNIAPVSPSKVVKATFPFSENNARVNLISSSSAVNDEQIERKKKKQSHYQLLECVNGINTTIGKERSYRKLTQLKRNFQSEEKKLGGGILPCTTNVAHPNDPEKKIFDWLEKLRVVKEIERKKIMGLS